VYNLPQIVLVGIRQKRHNRLTFTEANRSLNPAARSVMLAKLFPSSAVRNRTAACRKCPVVAVVFSGGFVWAVLKTSLTLTCHKMETGTAFTDGGCI
jgi:hypothetical protein